MLPLMCKGNGARPVETRFNLQSRPDGEGAVMLSLDLRYGIVVACV